LSNFYYPAHHELLRNDLLKFNRLYAFPSKPTVTKDCKIILDSGAFHLYKAKKQLNDKYIERLITHYNHYSGLHNIYCIAADTIGSITASIDKAKMMQEQINNICPVLHNLGKGCIDLFSLKKQIKIYSQFCNNRFIAMGNNDLDSTKQHKEIKYIADMAKSYFQHFHVFGAGYSAQDVLNWKKTGADSVDSIGYYTDALRGVVWSGDYSEQDNFKSMSLKNLKEANKLCY
jgi:hypothetical protein